MVELTQTYKQHSQVLATELDPTEAVLLHFDSQRYFTLNETGWRIWNLLKDESTLATIAERLQDEYDIDSQHAQKSVLALIEELRLEKLVEPVNGSI